MAYACFMDIKTSETVCINIKKKVGMANCVTSKRLVKFVEMPSGDVFAKNDMPYQQLTVGVIFLNCVFVTRTKL